jgi:hypothetical protein
MIVGHTQASDPLDVARLNNGDGPEAIVVLIARTVVSGS